MLTLYALLLVMLLVALALISRPFLAAHTLFTRTHLFTTAVIITLSISLYVFTSQQAGLSQWLSAGKAHYELMQTLQNAGGVNGLIKQVKNKLAKNPNDAQGWLILSKLYFMQHNEMAAEAALQKARSLQKK